MTQRIPVVPAVSNDVPLNTRRVLIALKSTVEYLLAQQGTTTNRFTSASQANSDTGAGVTTHNALIGLQGGVPGSYYHLTGSQSAELLGSGDSSLHYHSSDRNRANHTGTQAWPTVDKTGSNITDIESRSHDDLQGLQGGAVGDRYHMTLAQLSDLISAANTSLHYHDSDRARANHTGTQTASTISDQMNFGQILAFAAAHG